MTVLKHVFLILLAYFVAAIVTGFVVTACLQFDNGGAGEDARQDAFGFGLMVSFFVATFAAMPAAVVVTLGEYKAWRMWWYYAVAGSAIGVVLGYMFQPPAFFSWLGLAFGPVSGLIYWAIAGRNAGLANIAGRRVVVVIFALISVVSLLSSVPLMFGLVR